MFDIKVITQPFFFKNETELIIQLFKNGLDNLHLRKPEATKDEIIRFLSTIDSSFHNRITIHSHYSLINEFDLRGIHCTQKGKDSFFEISRTNIKKSISTHSFAEILALDYEFDYVFLSPVFNSISKQGYSPTLSQNEIKEFLNLYKKFPIYALGGITPNNIAMCKIMGFKGVALLGYVWESKNPSDVLKMLFSTLNQS